LFIRPCSWLISITHLRSMRCVQLLAAPGHDQQLRDAVTGAQSLSISSVSPQRVALLTAPLRGPMSLCRQADHEQVDRAVGDAAKTAAQAVR
jgi:hypothetical protein